MKVSAKIIVVLISLLFAASAYAGTDSLMKGLVGHWRLDQESYNPATKRFTDLSAYGNHGTSANAGNFTTDRMGQSDRALRFNGTSDYVDCGNDESLDTIDVFTISAWVNPTLLITQKVAVSKWQIGGQYSYIFDLSVGKPRLVLSSDGTATAGMKEATSPLSVSQNQYVVVIYNGPAQTVDFYVDGVEVSSTIISGSIPTSLKNSTDSVRLGATTGGFYKGSMAGVRIYNRVLTESERILLFESYRPKIEIDSTQSKQSR